MTITAKIHDKYSNVQLRRRLQENHIHMVQVFSRSKSMTTQNYNKCAEN
jgi:hypothetical protein